MVHRDDSEPLGVQVAVYVSALKFVSARYEPHSSHLQERQRHERLGISGEMAKKTQTDRSLTRAP